jgi:hypothetical protein
MTTPARNRLLEEVTAAPTRINVMEVIKRYVDDTGIGFSDLPDDLHTQLCDIFHKKSK